MHVRSTHRVKVIWQSDCEGGVLSQTDKHDKRGCHHRAVADTPPWSRLLAELHATTKLQLRRLEIVLDVLAREAALEKGRESLLKVPVPLRIDSNRAFDSAMAAFASAI